MCVNVVINKKDVCQTIGELCDALGCEMNDLQFESCYEAYEDLHDNIDEGYCLCPVDIASTAFKYGYWVTYDYINYYLKSDDYTERKKEIYSEDKKITRRTK